MRTALVLLLVSIPGLASAQTSPGTGGGFNVYAIPGIVAVDGKNGTRFISDVAATNPGTAPAFVAVSLVPSGGLPTQMLSLDPGQTLVWRDVLLQLWDASSFSGALSIVSDEKLILRARTYNTASSGTFGVALPVYGAGDYLSPGQKAHALWVSQSPDPNAGHRTNVAVFFPDAGGGSATVRISDGDGILIGQRDYALDAAGFQQLSVSTYSSPAVVARAEIEVTSGHAAGYSVVVDNVTGDSSLFPFEPLPAGIQDVLVSGVARIDGKLGTFFRTDGRFYNPGTVDAAVTVAFHANQNANPSPATGSITVPAGKILDMTDVLGTLLGLPKGSAGAVRFQSDEPVGILCRTSNVDPTGVKPGTFGAQQKPVPLLSFLSSADAGALVTGIRQNGAYRTNVGFAAGAEGATYQLTLKSAIGVTVATATRSLGSFGWEQPAIDKIFSSVPADAQLLVKVTLGSVDVFDSSVDNGSGDSVVTPAPALPTDIPSSGTIGPAGGSVRSDDGLLTLRIPAGALFSPIGFSITTTTEAGAPNGSGPVYRIMPSTASLAGKALLSLAFDRQDLALSAGTLGLAFQKAGGWYGVTGGSIDASRGTLTVVYPAAAPAPGVRAPLADPVWDAWEGYHGYILTPQRSHVLEGSSQSILFEVDYVGPGSAVGFPATPFPLASQKSGTNFSWYANGFLGGNDRVGTMSRETDTPGVLYSVPGCAPPVSVFVEARFTSPDGKPAVVAAIVDVFPRYWDVTIEQFISSPTCGASPFYGWFTYKWGTLLKGRFSLDQSFQVVRDEGVSEYNKILEPPQWCGEGRNCFWRALSLGDFPVGEITSIGGGWRSAWGAVQLNLSFWQHGVPSLRFSNSSCTNKPDSTIYAAMPGHGRNETYALYPGGIAFDVEEPWLAPESGIPSVQHFAVTVKPVKRPECP